MVIAFWARGVGGNAFSYVSVGKEYLVWIAITAWIIFIGYDIAKRFRRLLGEPRKMIAGGRNFFVRYWQTIKLVSTLGFFLILIHSLGIGRDLQGGTLQYVWIFYGTSAAIATFYTYVELCSDQD